MKEKDVTRQFMQQWKEDDPSLFWYKIPDFPKSMIVGDSRVRFSPEKPFDVIVCWGRRFLAIEWKIHKGSGAIPCDAVRKNQIDALIEVENADGHGCIAIAHFHKSTKQIFVLPASAWVDCVKSVILTRKSIPLDHLWVFSKVIEKRRIGRKERWDTLKFREACIFGAMTDVAFRKDREREEAQIGKESDF